MHIEQVTITLSRVETPFGKMNQAEVSTPVLPEEFHSQALSYHPQRAVAHALRELADKLEKASRGKFP